jgi:hypothetical protein
MNDSPKPAEFKSTLWSKFWSSMGVLFLSMGLVSGSSTLYFLATSIAADVTVADVIHHQKPSTKSSYSYVFEAQNPIGGILSHQAKMQVGRTLHTEGQIVAGRVSQSSGKVLSNEILASFAWLAIVTVLAGLYLGRRVVLGPIAYWFGRSIGPIAMLLARFKIFF